MKKKPKVSKYKLLYSIDCVLFTEQDKFVCGGNFGLGEQLKRLRKEVGLTQTQLGRKLHTKQKNWLSPMAISKWEENKVDLLR